MYNNALCRKEVSPAASALRHNFSRSFDKRENGTGMERWKGELTGRKGFRLWVCMWAGNERPFACKRADHTESLQNHEPETPQPCVIVHVCSAPRPYPYSMCSCFRRAWTDGVSLRFTWTSTVAFWQIRDALLGCQKSTYAWTEEMKAEAQATSTTWLWMVTEDTLLAIWVFNVNIVLNIPSYDPVWLCDPQTNLSARSFQKYIKP